MSEYYQETDTGIIFHVKEWGFSDEKIANETISGSAVVKYFFLDNRINVISEALNKIKLKENSITKNRAKEILLNIQKLLEEFANANMNVWDIPNLRAFLPDDDSILMEWQFSNYRLGFSVEPSLEESGWYLVTDKDMGSINASGFIGDGDLKPLLLWLINFVIAHS